MTSQPTLALIDYGSGNLRSVAKALEACGATVRLAGSVADLSRVDAVVVPGVGAFGDCARNLSNSGLKEPILEWLHNDKPYLGICLGYQLLFQTSEESPGAEGLGYFKGRVVRFPKSPLKIPHMGWNTLQKTRGPLYASADLSSSFYFVHSFYPSPDDPALVSAWCDYGGEFAASVSRGRVHATQFHPEKSQKAGLELLAGFLRALNEA
ncbi:MAG: imidazole glycerol phosphate synthase subunit HisH [Terrimicrobiaceae bacterium]